MIYDIANESDNGETLYCLYNLDSRPLYASKAHKTKLGYDPIVFLSLKVQSLIHPEDLPMLQKVCDACITLQQDKTVNFRIKHIKGHWIEITSEFKPYSINGVVKYLLVAGTVLENQMRLIV